MSLDLPGPGCSWKPSIILLIFHAADRLSTRFSQIPKRNTTLIFTNDSMTSISQHLPSAAHHEACDELRHQGQTNQELAVLAVSSGGFYGFPLRLYHLSRVFISKNTSIDESISSNKYTMIQIESYPHVYVALKENSASVRGIEPFYCMWQESGFRTWLRTSSNGNTRLRAIVRTEMRKSRLQMLHKITESKLLLVPWCTIDGDKWGTKAEY